jgi:hypothetical protein
VGQGKCGGHDSASIQVAMRINILVAPRPASLALAVAKAFANVAGMNGRQAA